jgi:hypothetical protein
VTDLPSVALAKFEGNLLVDVDRIVDSHRLLNHEGGGRRSLGHLTRSGVLMLCAAWELYLEELLMESSHHLAGRAATPDLLPLQVQKEIAKAVRSSDHDLKPLQLAGYGWRTVYSNLVGRAVSGLNTPKSTNVDPLFKRTIGLDGISDSWAVGKDAIDDFVRVRGEIAHRGRDAAYVRIGGLKAYRVTAMSAVVDTDNTVADFVQANSAGGSPWRRRNR